MSYSYIKSVFPNFETSKVYSEDIYNSIPKAKVESKNEIKVDEPKPFGAEKYVSNFNLNNNVVSGNGITLQQPQPQQPEPSKDNLKFYNLPYIPSSQPKIPDNIPRNITGDYKKVMETFDDEYEQNGQQNGQQNGNFIDHNKYILHVLGCKRCKDSLLKQLNIWDDKIKMESYMELASYIIFGIFIIMLIDTLNKK